MTFKRICEHNKGQPIPDKNYRGDTGFLVFADILKYDLKYKDIDNYIYENFAQHYGGTTILFDYCKNDICERCDGDNIPDINLDDFNIDSLKTNTRKNWIDLLKNICKDNKVRQCGNIVDQYKQRGKI